MSSKKMDKLMRGLAFRHFRAHLEYTTDPVREFGVQYDKSKQVVIDGQKHDAIYGVTPLKVMVWTIHMRKRSSGAVKFLDDWEFFQGNLIAFYWIHRKKLVDQFQATEQDIKTTMAWFAEHLYESSADLGINLDVHRDMGVDPWGSILAIVWKHKDLHPGVGGLSPSYRAFYKQTDIFPGNTWCTKEILMEEAQAIIISYIDKVREAMDLNDKWVTSEVVNEGQVHDLKRIEAGKQLPEEVQSKSKIAKTTKHRVNTYWDALGVKPLKERKKIWIQGVLDKDRFIWDVNDLAEQMQVNPTNLRRSLPREGPFSKEWIEERGLLAIARDSVSKEEFIRRTGVSQATLYRKVSKYSDLKRVWDKI